MLTDDAVLPIALGDNWIYALPSSAGLVLIDAGPDYEGAWETLVAQLDAAGFAASDVRIVAITHAHIDHCGLARRWQEAGAVVAGCASEAERFALGDRVVRYQQALVFRFFADCGVPAARIEDARAGRRAARRRRERWPGRLRGTPFTVNRALADGDAVGVGERRLRMVAAPGHTPGNAAFYEEATGLLFSGDQLLPQTTASPGIHFQDGGGRLRSLPAYSRSLERIRQLGARRLYPGHGDYGGEVESAIAWALEHHRRRQERLLDCLRERALTPYEMLERLFPRLPAARLWQGMAEVVGHIDALVERGAIVEEQGENGALLVRVAPREATPSA